MPSATQQYAPTLFGQFASIRMYTDGTSAERLDERTTDTWSFLGRIDSGESFSWSGELATSDGYVPLAVVHKPGPKSNQQVCAKAMEVVDALPAGNQKRLAYSLLIGIQNAILGNQQYRENVKFRPVEALSLDDETLLIEWIYPQGRVSFYIDADIEDSSVVYLDGLVDDGQLPNTTDDDLAADRIDEIAIESVEFVSRFA